MVDMTEYEFKDWYKKADSLCLAQYGLSLADLPDICYRDLFQDGYTPSQCVREAMANADPSYGDADT